MSDRGTLTNEFNNPGRGFTSIFDASDEGAAGLNGDTLSDVDDVSSTKMETETIYIDESANAPPELDELSTFVQEGWDIVDISLGYRKSDDEYCFVVSLEREAPPSFFEFVSS